MGEAKQTSPSPILACPPSGLPRLYSSWASLQPRCGPLAPPSSPLAGHTLGPGSWGSSTVSSLALGWVPTPLVPCYPSPLVLKGRGNGPGMNYTQGILGMPPTSQGESRPPVFHLYQDCLHTFVIKGRVIKGSGRPF